MPFYKKTEDELLVAPNFVSGPGFDLRAEEKDSYQFPVDGWYWFDNLDLALAGLQQPTAIEAVTMRQARLALHAKGLLTVVVSAIDSLPEPQKTAAKIEWEYSSEVHRQSQMTNLIAAVLGLTEQQVDDLFALAASL